MPYRYGWCILYRSNERNPMAKNTKATRSEKELAKLAAKVCKLLKVETLDTRKSDRLDFHDVSVASLREIISLSFEAGFNAGYAVKGA